LSFKTIQNIALNSYKKSIPEKIFTLFVLAKQKRVLKDSQNVDKPYQSCKIALLKVGYYIVETLRNADIMLFLRVFFIFSSKRKRLKKIVQNGLFLQSGHFSNPNYSL